MSFSIGPGFSIGAGFSITKPPVLKLSLDAATYSSLTASAVQNVSGTSTDTGFFYQGGGGWVLTNWTSIQPGWTVVGEPSWVVTAVNPGAQTVTITGGVFLSGQSYGFTSANTWIDSVGNLPFVLYDGVTYNSGNGGYLSFDPTSGQYAECSTSLSSLNTWSVEAWHYYTGTNTGTSPCIVTETFVGGTINYALGSLNDNSPGLMAGWYGGSWNMSPYTLTAGNWYQIVGTCDGTTTKLYVNNTLVEQVASTGTPTSSGAGIRLMDRWDAAEFWGGRLGIVKIWDGALDQTGVTTEWNANRTRFGL